MTAIFLTIADMSFSACWLILAVLGLRLFLRATPRWGNLLAWGIVVVRLLVPFSIESRSSLIPVFQTVDTSPVTTVISLPVGETSAATVTSSLPFEEIISIIWLAGLVILMTYFAVSYLRLLRRLDTAVLLCENIYQSELIAAPIVVGIVKPKIYIPFNVEQQSLTHIIAHEKSHIRRKDHWWKLLAFASLAFHWFNPLVWIAYVQICRDIELACDEAVVSKLDCEGRGDYAQALMTFSAKNLGFSVYPMGFSTIDTKGRIKAIANYRRPGAEKNLLLAGCCLFLVVCFMTDPVTPGPEMPPADHMPQLQDEVPPNTTAPSAHVPSEEELRAELEKLEQSLAFYEGHLVEDRDLFAYKKLHEKADEDDLLGLKLSMAFYRRMIIELECKIRSLEKQIKQL